MASECENEVRDKCNFYQKGLCSGPNNPEVAGACSHRHKLKQEIGRQQEEPQDED